MNQADLNRAVAEATGESVSTIKRLGFLLAEPSDCLAPEADELSPYVIDWDELEAQRAMQDTRSRGYEPNAA